MKRKHTNDQSTPRKKTEPNPTEKSSTDLSETEAVNVWKLSSAREKSCISFYFFVDLRSPRPVAKGNLDMVSHLCSIIEGTEDEDIKSVKEELTYRVLEGLGITHYYPDETGIKSKIKYPENADAAKTSLALKILLKKFQTFDLFRPEDLSGFCKSLSLKEIDLFYGMFLMSEHVHIQDLAFQLAHRAGHDINRKYLLDIMRCYIALPDFLLEKLRPLCGPYYQEFLYESVFSGPPLKLHHEFFTILFEDRTMSDKSYIDRLLSKEDWVQYFGENNYEYTSLLYEMSFYGESQDNSVYKMIQTVNVPMPEEALLDVVVRLNRDDGFSDPLHHISKRHVSCELSNVAYSTHLSETCNDVRKFLIRRIKKGTNKSFVDWVTSTLPKFVEYTLTTGENSLSYAHRGANLISNTPVESIVEIARIYPHSMRNVLLTVKHHTRGIERIIGLALALISSYPESEQQCLALINTVERKHEYTELQKMARDKLCGAVNTFLSKLITLYTRTPPHFYDISIIQ